MAGMEPAAVCQIGLAVMTKGVIGVFLPGLIGGVLGPFGEIVALNAWGVVGHPIGDGHCPTMAPGRGPPAWDFLRFYVSITTCYASWANAPLSRTMCHSPSRHFCWPRPRCSALEHLLAGGAARDRRPSAGVDSGAASASVPPPLGGYCSLLRPVTLKLEHYGLPAFPALAVLIAHYWRTACRRDSSHRSGSPPLSALILPSLLLASQAVPLGSAVETCFQPTSNSAWVRPRVAHMPSR